MKKFIRIGVDLAKNYFQVHALESEDGRAMTRKLKRSKMHEFFRELSPASLAWRPAARRIIGGVNSRRGTRSAADAPGLHQAVCQAR